MSSVRDRMPVQAEYLATLGHDVGVAPSMPRTPQSVSWSFSCLQNVELGRKPSCLAHKTLAVGQHDSTSGTLSSCSTNRNSKSEVFLQRLDRHRAHRVAPAYPPDHSQPCA